MGGGPCHHLRLAEYAIKLLKQKKSNEKSKKRQRNWARVERGVLCHYLRYCYCKAVLHICNIDVGEEKHWDCRAEPADNGFFFFPNSLKILHSYIIVVSEL